MNFLGHLYLSNKNPNILIGNFIADEIKGKKYLLYPLGIQKGILLHREIDTTTDTDNNLRSLKKHLYPYVNKYAGVVIDIYLDHVLAKHWAQFCHIPLNTFAWNSYFILLKNQHYLPIISKYILLRMILGNWLMAYSSFNGFSRALKGMSLRRLTAVNLLNALVPIKKNNVLFEDTCLLFLKDISEKSA
jgi:acyl carrier protein phosphodiesterase